MALLLPGRALVLQQGSSKQPAAALAPRSRPRVLTAARRTQHAAATRRSVVMSASECPWGAGRVVPPSCTRACMQLTATAGANGHLHAHSFSSTHPHDSRLAACLLCLPLPASRAD
jgi:hypothetical protein